MVLLVCAKPNAYNSCCNNFLTSFKFALGEICKCNAIILVITAQAKLLPDNLTLLPDKVQTSLNSPFALHSMPSSF